MCILQGLHYTDPIKGLTPATSLKLIKECGNIENVLEKVAKSKKFEVAEPFPYVEARELFIKPNVINLKRDLNKMVKFNHFDEEGLKEFMVEEKGFALRTVNTQIGNLLESYKVHGIVKVRAVKSATAPKAKAAATKAKASPEKEKPNVSKAKTSAAKEMKTTKTKASSPEKEKKTTKAISASPKPKKETPKKATPKKEKKADSKK